MYYSPKVVERGRYDVVGSLIKGTEILTDVRKEGVTGVF